MAELIKKKLVLKNIASFAIGGDPQEEPMANVNHIGMSIEDLPTTTEAEIRAKAYERFAEALLTNEVVDKSVVRRVAEQLKEE